MVETTRTVQFGVGRSADIEVEFGTLRVYEWGPQDASDVIFFWHGAEFHTGLSISEVATVLAERGVRTIAPDAPGFGRSPAPFTDRPELAEPSRLAEIAADVVRHRCDGSALFVGHSWGAHIGCWAAADASRLWRGLLLIDGGFFDFGDLFTRLWGIGPIAALARLHDRFDDVSFADWSAYFSHLRQSMLRWTPEQDAMYRSAAKETPDGRVVPIISGATATAIAAGLVEHPTSLAWPGLRAGAIPVHLMLSTEPPAAAADRQRGFLKQFLGAVPAATTERVAAATHEMVDDAHLAVIGRILACLGASDSPPATEKDASKCN